MTIGLPIVALATTEMAQLVRTGHNGVADTRIDVLVDAMRTLIRDPRLAAEWGAAARRDALERFGIERFARDWDDALRAVAA
ncbi:glycosyl transferases group 1 family protein [Burkholderia mallei NCTC 10247]|nr:glycosyltransferase [Burkholderia mallei SAVP1]AIP73638.1 glycosyl transferases group 1 family protein [Burkholderia mallei]AIS27371.1 glycosyl transferases group 1 family protein [Burkholderia mallei NCTC 10247]AJX04803.1 glycosyl transferases group 1 family protein [Burkholderia mallei]AJX45538.1 glycosyl transferases group 1 family protein [Burkholderia mallei]